MEQRYVSLLTAVSAIMIHANAIKLQSWGDIKLESKGPIERANQVQVTAAKQKLQACSCFKEKLKIWIVLSNFLIFKVWGKFFV